jgi:hypothetical protein
MCASARDVSQTPLLLRIAAAAAFVLAAASAGPPGVPIFFGALCLAMLAPRAALFTSALIVSGAAKYYPVNFLAMSGGMFTVVQILYQLQVLWNGWIQRLRGPPTLQERYARELALREAPTDDGLGVFAFSFGNLLLWIWLALPPPFPG